MKLLAVMHEDVARTIIAAGSMLSGTEIIFVHEGNLAAALERRAGRSRLSLFSRRRELMRLVEQQRVLEALIPFGPALPARPDAFIADEAEARLLLEVHGSLFQAQLESFGGTLQYQVTVEGAPDVGDARGFVAASLSSVSRDLMHLPLAGDGMFANVVALIERGREPELETALVEIDTAFGTLCRIRMIGPMPPVSFAAIDVSPFDDEAVMAAARILDVDPAIDPDELRKAYLEAVVRSHPDRVGASGNEALVGAASDAYRLLTRYGAARARKGQSRTLSVSVVRQNETERRAA